MDTLFAWQCHLGRCVGDGRRLQAHEVVKRALKDLVLSNPSHGGAAFPASSALIEPLHLRKDRSRPGDILALDRDVHRLDTAMDLVIASALQKSCSSSTHKSSDIVLKAAEKSKFGKDLSSANPISFFFFYDAFCALGSQPLRAEGTSLSGSSEGVCYDCGH